MKFVALFFCFVLFVIVNFSQTTSSLVEIVTVYSQNEKFFLKTIPYDNESPTLRGKTIVFENGKTTPFYEFERGFDSVDKESNNLILSNDGEIIFFIIPWGADEEKEGLKSITIYKKGKIFRSYTISDITGCDLKKERCNLIYNNYWEVIDKEKSNWGTKNYKRVFKDGVSEQEKFLADFAIFSLENIVYLTDSKKQTHLFDLKEGSYVRSQSFETLFEQFKFKGRFSKIAVQRFQSPTFLNYPNLKNGQNTLLALANFLGMKPIDYSKKSDEQFKWYRFKINSSIFQDGTIEIEDIELFDELPKEKIVEFFKINKFDTSSIPKEFEKWYIDDEYFYFRKANSQVARKEKQREIQQQREAHKQRLVAEKINNIYIPKDLGECFIELDKLLSEVDKKEIQSLAKRSEMVRYHMGLGMWLRNNWGLWGGSRLQKYFMDRKTSHPDDMSGVILEYYYDWLNGKKDSWKEWDKNPK